ncbi:MAG: DDE-type integrase/transposase/recombinase [Candidatus Omnitrophota bacterium]
MNEHMREDLIKKVEGKQGQRSQMLGELKIPRATYYKWRKAYDENGVSGLAKTKPGPKRVWNRLAASEENRVLEIARLHPELSPRLLAIQITDQEDFSISESTVYRILKENNLIAPRPLPEMPAAKEWRHKTKGPDEIWQCDATSLFIVGWGYYKLIPVEDDFSRKIIAWDLKADETAFSFADIVKMAVENARKEGHLIEREEMPRLYTDNGPGFTSKLMDKYLSNHGIRHILGTPYHPQGRGKIERFNRRIKENLCLMVYCSPEELKKAIDAAITAYNITPHESQANVCPNDVYAGRKEVVLQKRQEKKRLTLERRKKYNLEGRNANQNNSPDKHQISKSN